MFYSYCGFDEHDNCVALVSADPDDIEDAAEAIKEWKANGWYVILHPRDRAVELHIKSIQSAASQPGTETK